MTLPGALASSIGTYRPVAFLGAGGMGEVYRAVDTRSGRTVALKLLSSSGFSGSLRARFLNEAHVQAGLSHPHVATLYEFLEHDGRPCLAMEFVEGETLADRLARQGRLPIREAVGILRPLADAVAYVHAQGIVHRDLKPTNIRITPGGVVKLLDFGIAKLISVRGPTRTGSVIGTPCYLSPEQLRGGEASVRSDVWALGVLFYEMLTGRVPFEAETLTELWERVNAGTYQRVEEPTAATGAARRAVARANAIIRRCLKRDPSARYASVSDLLAELDQLREPEVPKPWTAGLVPGLDAWRRRVAWERLPTAGWSALERHWATLAVAAVLVVAVAVLWTLSMGGSASPASTAPAATGRPADAGERATLQIDVQQGRADVYVNGEFRGQTPYRHEGRFGETIEVELRQEGFLPARHRVDLTHQRAVTLAMEPRSR